VYFLHPLVLEKQLKENSKKIQKNMNELNVESDESNYQKCKAAEQDKRAATRPVAHNRIKISVNIVEY
jgi:hypothetical protein